MFSDPDRATFSILKSSEGGYTIAEMKELLKANGVTGFKKEYSPYVGHWGFSIPRKFITSTLEYKIFARG